MLSEAEYRINALMDNLITRVNEQHRRFDAIDERTRKQHKRIEELLEAVTRLESKRGASGFGDRLGNVLFWTGLVGTVVIGWATWDHFGLPRTSDEWVTRGLALVPMTIGWVLRYLLAGQK